MYRYHNWRLLHPAADGAAAGAADPAAPPAGGDDGGKVEAPAPGEGDPDDPAEESVTMTKAELDRQIAQAEKRGARQARSAKAAAAPKDDDGAEAARQAEAKLQQANQRMLAAEVKSQGADKGITANGLTVAARIIDTADCLDENGEVDEDAVSDALDEFLNQYPEFKQAAEAEVPKPGFLFQGNPSKAGEQNKPGGAKKLNEHRITK